MSGPQFIKKAMGILPSSYDKLDLDAVLAAARAGSFAGLPSAERKRDALGTIRGVDADVVRNNFV